MSRRLSQNAAFPGRDDRQPAATTQRAISQLAPRYRVTNCTRVALSSWTLPSARNLTRHLRRNRTNSSRCKEAGEIQSFVVGGHVGHPGKYELRADTTVTEAIAIACGFLPSAKHSHVVLFRRARVLQEKARTTAPRITT